MAFKVKSKRCGSGDSETCSCQPTTNGNTVATQAWVKKILDRIWDWTNCFKAREVQVLGTTTSDEVRANTVNADRIYANGLVLSDINGRPVMVYVGEDGTLKTMVDFEGVYVFPGVDGNTGLKFYQFSYAPDMDIYDNFKGLSEDQINSKFVGISMENSITADGVECPWLCAADGAPELVGRTILITCPASRVITGLTICNEDLEPMKRIYMPNGKGTRKLTINMPQFVVDGATQTIGLPMASSDSGSSSGCQCPCCTGAGILTSTFITPVASRIKLDPSLFDDSDLDGNPLPPSTTGCCCCRGSVQEVEPEIVDLAEFSDDGESGSSDSASPSVEVQYKSYVHDNYSNIALKRDVFGNTGKKRFLVVETEKV